ncbi:matrixin family metalloprotease [Paenibacillus wynnii]|uniref:matrixin family metalloprotease n=1 Tax=Paenibacillus wynnii TaxID=268407 RepID=UPI0027D87EA1|nr:matrixin family metalloprotease [Paenibacillus wynnii]
MLLKKIRKPLFSLLILSSFAIGASSTYAYKIWYSGGYRPYPVSGSPIVVHPYSTFDTESITAMNNGAAQWNSAGAGTLLNIGSTTTNTSYPNDNDLNQVTKGARGTDQYLMQTHVTSSGYEWVGAWYVNAIYEADIDVNISHPWSNAVSGNSNYYDVGNSFTHELGHLLGLDHSGVSGATMWSGSSPGTIYKRDIAQDDIDGIKDLY